MVLYKSSSCRRKGRLMTKLSCVGFTDKGYGDSRGIDNMLAFKRACAILCDSCGGKPGGGGSGELPVNRWAVSYRCAKPGERDKYCNYECVLLITKISRVAKSPGRAG